ncbi:GtrA family protein [Desulfobacter curvatus]|uniref:GtrA family protein n=1 Tax=Desulfobacter curvatus TaxID=2290 RepID=UPI000368946B|nr:GtrA family protein [Desulfobacter curvatus]
MRHYQLVKYGIVGISSAAIHFCVASIFVSVIYKSFFLSNVSGFFLAFLWSYFAQSKYVFSSNFSKIKGMKFFFVQATSLLLVIGIANKLCESSIYLKIFVVAMVLPVCAFFVHKFWTFVDNK